MGKSFDLPYDYKKIKKYFNNALYLDTEDYLTMESYTKIYAKEFTKRELKQILNLIDSSLGRSVNIQTYAATILSILTALGSIIIAISFPLIMVFLADLINKSEDIPKITGNIINKTIIYTQLSSCVFFIFMSCVAINGVVSIQRYKTAQKLCTVVQIIKSIKYTKWVNFIILIS